MLAREPDHARRHLVTLGFLAGFGHAHAERLDLIIPSGREDELAPRLCAIFKMLRHECDVVRLNHLPQESPNYPHLHAALKAGYRHAGVMNRHACRISRLPATWAEYEARHSSNWRNQLRRRSRAFFESGDSRASLAGDHIPGAEAMRRLGELHAMNWPEHISTFLTPVSWRFHCRLAERWLPQQRAIMPLLESGGEVIAAIYGFIERDEFFQYQMGWSPAYSRLSPGRLVIRACIEATIRRGLSVHDMLPSDYEYKRQWCHDVRWLVDLEGCNATSWRATAFHALRTFRRLFPRPTHGHPPQEASAS
jgi:CelD/BcsL family acetyltransferase involved in cellulose biosynthesis